MNIQSFVGFRLESCRFSRASYTFELSGKLDGQFATWLVGTNGAVSAVGTARVDAGEDVSRCVWPFLERELVRIEVDETNLEVVFDFGAGHELCFWHDSVPMDNLLLARDRDSDAWFPVL